MEKTIETSVVTSDITHPSVDIIEVTLAARGWFPQDPAHELLHEWAAKHKVTGPQRPGLGVYLKRAMEEMAKGPDRELKVTGRKGTAVYTLIQLSLDKVDREEHDGRGVGDAEVSARIQVDPNVQDAYTVKISPPEHPAAPSIRSAFDRYCGLYSATYDLKVWLGQQALPALGAIKSTDAQGKYLIRATATNRDALLELREVLDKVASGGQGRLKLYFTGRAGSDATAVDLITDALMEENERVTKKLEDILDAHERGEKTLGKRGVATQALMARDLRKRLVDFAKAVGASIEDCTAVIDDLEGRIALVELSNE